MNLLTRASLDTVTGRDHLESKRVKREAFWTDMDADVCRWQSRRCLKLSDGSTIPRPDGTTTLVSETDVFMYIGFYHPVFITFIIVNKVSITTLTYPINILTPSVKKYTPFN